ncbi:MAG: endonuclease MutS2 [Ruminococcus sp.]|nr:endonuclease MutS2 [Ruminococcus sp.]MCM1381704.1 endonuclease MutS2 [Muribaculaceae bacterium]MCM1479585.1 endonuclease MutS2 [Muribaculaceae bacterium]
MKITMNKYYTSLELHKILEMLSEECSNELTKENALALEPLTDVDGVRREVKKTSDAFDLSVKYGTPAFCNFKDVRGSLTRAKSGASLTLRELLDIAQMLYQVRMLSDWHISCGDEETSIGYLFTSLSPNKYLEDKIKDAIISEEEISDMASSALADIRRKIARAGVKIRESLDKLVKSSEVQKSLQENIVTMRDGRYVLPVKAEHKGNIQGLVHATSSSGATYFVEPISVVEANNEIRVLQGQEQDEIERIIAEMSADCAAYAEQISNDYLTCAELNLYFAKSNLAAKMRASVPEICDNGQIDLKKARHPLIDKSKVVPVDIRLGYDYQALIVTGPNTGGKTVLLKTVGLLTLMTMCGLLIPAGDGSRISVFENILVDIGDRQSIENSLSTFSSHIGNVAEILEIANSSSLILFDELGSGTDPVEGAALAVAIIEDLKSKGSRLLVTTHYQELKLYAIEGEGIENASCEFDAATMQPTYRLIIGSPGKSNAFSISSKLGIPDCIIKRANELVSTENQRFEEVIARLEETRIELEKRERETAELKREQEQKLAELEREIDSLNKSREDEISKARAQAMRIVESCRAQADALMDELNGIKKQKDKDNFSQLAVNARSKSKSALNKMFDTANPVTSAETKEYVPPRPFKRGDNVVIVGVNKKGILAGEPDSSGMVYVQSGIMKTKISVKKLRLIEPEKVTYQNKKVSTKDVRGKMERSSSLELDIRGSAVDEGIHEVDMFLDNAVLAGAGIVTIIHGKGTGTLRQGIHRHLKSHPSVKSFRLGRFGEGEDGVTVVELK